jgi:methylmalonyl-CoA/ethylmalonyl-CoA epimerase
MIDPIQSDLGDLVERLDHVAVAVNDLPSASKLMTAIGATFLGGGDHVVARFRWAQFSVPGGGTIELITPLPDAGDDHFLVKFLNRQGDGMHHITLKVSSLARAIAIMESGGYRVVGIADDLDSWKEAFVHPKTSHGLLIQLAEWDDTKKVGPTTLDDVLAGTPDGYDT